MGPHAPTIATLATPTGKGDGRPGRRPIAAKLHSVAALRPLHRHQRQRHPRPTIAMPGTTIATNACSSNGAWVSWRGAASIRGVAAQPQRPLGRVRLLGSALALSERTARAHGGLDYRIFQC